MRPGVVVAGALLLALMAAGARAEERTCDAAAGECTGEAPERKYAAGAQPTDREQPDEQEQQGKDGTEPLQVVRAMPVDGAAKDVAAPKLNQPQQPDAEQDDDEEEEAESAEERRKKQRRQRKKQRHMSSLVMRILAVVAVIVIVVKFNLWKQKGRARFRADRKAHQLDRYRKQMERQLGDQMHNTEARLQLLMNKLTEVSAGLTGESNVQAQQIRHELEEMRRHAGVTSASAPAPKRLSRTSTLSARNGLFDGSSDDNDSS